LGQQERAKGRWDLNQRPNLGWFQWANPY